MSNLNQYDELKLMTLMAKEFLEERLGLHTTDKEVSLFVNHICRFQEEIAYSSLLNG